MRSARGPFRYSRGFTIVELLCIVLVILLLIALLMPALNKVKRVSTRVVCGSNLKGLGTAISVYANDYEDMYPQLPGEGPWSRQLGFAYDMVRPDFAEGGAQHRSGRTITASWFLLVREADVSPKAFVCPEAGQTSFEPRDYRRDLVKLWDFGSDPHQHVSYSMHNPYGRFPADGGRVATFAVGADMSPWFENGHIRPPGKDGRGPQLIPAYWRRSSYRFGERHPGNSWNHGLGKGLAGVGQNVLFADGHCSYHNVSDIGVEHDNIYTFWARDENPTEEDKRIGQNPTGRDASNDAKGEDDSFLAI